MASRTMGSLLALEARAEERLRAGAPVLAEQLGGEAAHLPRARGRGRARGAPARARRARSRRAKGELHDLGARVLERAEERVLAARPPGATGAARRDAGSCPIASTAAQAIAASGCVTSGRADGERARRVGVAQGAKRRAGEAGSRVSPTTPTSGLGAAEAAERAHRGELHVVLLVGQREDDRVGRRVASRLAPARRSPRAAPRVVVGERALEQANVARRASGCVEAIAPSRTQPRATRVVSGAASRAAARARRRRGAPRARATALVAAAATRSSACVDAARRRVEVRRASPTRPSASTAHATTSSDASSSASRSAARTTATSAPSSDATRASAAARTCRLASRATGREQRRDDRRAEEPQRELGALGDVVVLERLRRARRRRRVARAGRARAAPPPRAARVLRVASEDARARCTPRGRVARASRRAPLEQRRVVERAGAARRRARRWPRARSSATRRPVACASARDGLRLARARRAGDGVATQERVLRVGLEDAPRQPRLEARERVERGDLHEGVARRQSARRAPASPGRAPPRPRSRRLPSASAAAARTLASSSASARASACAPRSVRDAAEHLDRELAPVGVEPRERLDRGADGVRPDRDERLDRRVAQPDVHRRPERRDERGDDLARAARARARPPRPPCARASRRPPGRAGAAPWPSRPAHLRDLLDGDAPGLGLGLLQQPSDGGRLPRSRAASLRAGRAARRRADPCPAGRRAAR